jgi:hypothetical protein
MKDLIIALPIRFAGIGTERVLEIIDPFTIAQITDSTKKKFRKGPFRSLSTARWQTSDVSKIFSIDRVDENAIMKPCCWKK